MLKTITKIIFILSISIASLKLPNWNVSAETFNSDGFEYHIENGSAVITSYNGLENIITVPQTLNGFPVEVIDDYAFSNRSILSVNISNSVKYINDYAFSGNLISELTIPQGIVYIGSRAFSNNQIIKVRLEANIPNVGGYNPILSGNIITDVEYGPGVTMIPSRFFQEADVSSVDPLQLIAEGITSIGASAFYKSNLSSIVIPSTVESIGSGAFSTNMLTQLVIPSNVSTLGEYAFSNNLITKVRLEASIPNVGGYYPILSGNIITDVEYGPGVTMIPSRFFQEADVSSVDPLQLIAEGITSIGASAFYKANLSSIVIPSTVETIGDRAFLQNTLTQLAIPSNVSAIGEYAFSNNRLTELVIPSNVSTIGEYAFSNNLITKVRLEASIPNVGGYYPILSGNIITDVEYGPGVTMIPSRFFQETDVSSVDPLQLIAEGITSIGASAFYKANLSSIVIPSTVETIGDRAFSTNMLTQLVISSNVNAIGDYAFSNNQLTEIVIPESVSSIGGNAFSNNLITKVRLEANIPNVGGYNPILSGNIITDVEYGPGVTMIPSRFFQETDVSSVDPLQLIAEGITSIGASAFYKANLSSIVIPSTVESIGDRAFLQNMLTQLVIPFGVTYIGDYAFSNNQIAKVRLETNLTSVGWIYPVLSGNIITEVEYGPGVTMIPSRFFQEADVSSVDPLQLIAEGITSIGASAFYKSNLSSIVIPSTVETIGDRAFLQNTLTQLVIPFGVTYIGDYAFSNNQIAKVRLETNLTSVGWIYPVLSGNIITEVEYGPGVTMIPSRFFMDADLSNAEYTTIINDQILNIGNHSFYNSNLTRILIPKSVTMIGSWAFESNTDNPSDFTIYGYLESSASSYASENGHSFIDLDSGFLRYNIRYDGNQNTSGYAPLDENFYQTTDIAVILGNVNNLYRHGFIFSGWNTSPDGTGITYLPGESVVIETEDVILYAVWIQADNPDKAVLIASDDYKSVNLSWSYDGDIALIKSFDLYRSVEGENLFSYVRTTFKLNMVDQVSYGSYDYYVVATNIYGLTSTSNTVSAKSLSNDTINPVSVITTNSTLASINVPFGFYGANSYDNDGIISYQWDFGDGNTSNIMNPTHEYISVGDFTVSLTVRDASGNIEISTKIINVVDVSSPDFDTYSLVTFKILDAQTLNPIFYSSANIINEQIDIMLDFRDLSELTIVLPKGEYTLHTMASGFLTRSSRIVVNQSTHEVLAGLSSTSLVTGDLTVREMSYNEMIESGIDVSHPDNQHVYKFEVNIEFTASLIPKVFPIYYLVNQAGDRIEDNRGSEFNFDFIDPIDNTKRSLIINVISERFYLVIIGETKWLKEMFSVELLVNNHSKLDTIEECEAELILPDGLTFASMTGSQQSNIVKINGNGIIDPDQTASAKWYVRGDKEGNYQLTANLSGVFQPNYEPFRYSFTTQEPLKVYAGSALNLFITLDGMAKRGEEYTVLFELKNVSDKSLYNLNFKINEASQYKILYYETLSSDPIMYSSEHFQDNNEIGIGELKSNESVYIEFVTTIWFTSALELIDLILPPKAGLAYDLLFEIGFLVDNVFVTTLEGSTTEIPTFINVTPISFPSFFDKSTLITLIEYFLGESEIPFVEDIKLDEDPFETLKDSSVNTIIQRGIGLGGLQLEDTKIGGILYKAYSLRNRDAKTTITVRSGSSSVQTSQSTQESFNNEVIEVISTKSNQSIVNGEMIITEDTDIIVRPLSPGLATIEIKIETESETIYFEIPFVVEDIDFSDVIRFESSPEIIQNISMNKIDRDDFDMLLSEMITKEQQIISEYPSHFFDTTIEFVELSTGSDQIDTHALVLEEWMINKLYNETNSGFDFVLDSMKMSFNQRSMKELADFSINQEGMISISSSEIDSNLLQSDSNVVMAKGFTILATVQDNDVESLAQGRYQVRVPFTKSNARNEISVEFKDKSGYVEVVEHKYDSSNNLVIIDLAKFGDLIIKEVFAYDYAPTIALVGDSTLMMVIGSTYLELGAVGSDVEDGDLTNKITIDSSNLNVDVVGTYYVSYNLEDSSGNQAEEKIRVVHVVENAQQLSPASLISISKLPLKVNYLINENLDIKGLEVRVDMENSENYLLKVLDSMISGYDPYSTTYGPQTVTVTYQGLTTTFEVYLNRFIDVPYGHRNYVHINALVGLGIINGYSDNTFRPNNTLTRAQAAIMIVRAVGISTEGVSSNFTDVPTTHAAYKFISAAYQAGIINGYNDGTFKPNVNVTRAQIAIMVQRAFNVQASETIITFTDVPEGYAPKKFIEILASQKIVNGYSDGTFKPLNNVTRAQFSTMIYNAIQYAQKTE
jgi:PKD repeat protein